MHRRPLAGAAIIITALLGGWAWTGSATTPAAVQVGQALPGFELPLLDDNQHTLTPAALTGRPWVLNFWASWCAPCRDEHALLLALGRQTHAPLIGMNTRDDARSAQEWLRRWGNPYSSTVVDSEGRTGWTDQGLPQTWVIDGQGIVRLRHVGRMTAEVWQRSVLPLLRNPTDALRAGLPEPAPPPPAPGPVARYR